MNTVERIAEPKRGCGYRQPSRDGVGIYLVGGSHNEPCERLPFPLSTCPCCGAGIKFCRGYTWIEPTAIFDRHMEPQCNNERGHSHSACPMCNPVVVGNRAGLMWVGEKYYSPESFILEAGRLGISKKVASIPNGFRVGEHYIYLAHKKAIVDNAKLTVTAGVFMVFKPSRVDLVINDENAIPEKAVNLAKKLKEKARLLVVEPINEQGSLL